MMGQDVQTFPILQGLLGMMGYVEKEVAVSKEMGKD